MFKQYRELKFDEFIVVGADTAAGGNDWCAAQFLSVTNLDIPLVYHSKSLTTEMTGLLKEKLEEIHDTTGIPPLVAYERNNGGSFEMERLALLNKENKYQIFKMPTKGQINKPDPVLYGWTTSTATRPKMLADLKEAIDNKLLKIYDKPTLMELLSFVIVQTSSSWKAQAENSAHDDLVFALAIAYQLYQMNPSPKVTGGVFIPERVGLGGAVLPAISVPGHRRIIPDNDEVKDQQQIARRYALSADAATEDNYDNDFVYQGDWK